MGTTTSGKIVAGARSNEFPKSEFSKRNLD